MFLLHGGSSGLFNGLLPYVFAVELDLMCKGFACCYLPLFAVGWLWFVGDGINDSCISATDTRGASSPTGAMITILLWCLVHFCLGVLALLLGVVSCRISAFDTRSAKGPTAAFTTHGLQALCNGDDSAVVIYNLRSLVSIFPFTLPVKMLPQ